MSKRKDRILNSVGVLEVLDHLGVEVRVGGGEQQYRCTLHSGSDNAPSARAYPETNSTWCWACAQYRNPIGLFMDTLDLGFNEACTRLEEFAGLAVWDYSKYEKSDFTTLASLNEEVKSQRELEADANYTMFACKNYDGTDPAEWRQLSYLHLVAKNKVLK
jgi:hypothetical protein